MSSLARQPTPQSLLSWWSDSNPVGPTISLHAAAKPVMMLLYHRQALDLIRQSLWTPLSTDLMGIYTAYLAYRYVASATKSAVLAELQTRVKCEDDRAACAVVDSGLLCGHLVDQLCGSGAAKVRRAMAGLLGGMAWHGATLSAVASGAPCRWLVSFLKDKDIGVVGNAARGLALISVSPDGAQAIVEADVVDCMAGALRSPDATARWWTWQVLSRLVGHEHTREALMRANICARLASLLRDRSPAVVEHAARILSWLAIPADGAHAVLQQPNILHHVLELLRSPEPGERRWACAILGELASKRATAPAVLAANPCPRLVSLLHDEDTEVAVNAIHALCWIVRSRDGAHATVDAKFLGAVQTTLYFPDLRVRRRACQILVRLTRYADTARAVLAANPAAQLVMLSLHADHLLRTSALLALEGIAAWPAGARALARDADIDIVAHLAHLMDTRDLDIQLQACVLLRNLSAR